MNNLGPGLENVKIICINLKRRKDRKNKIKKLMRRHKLNFTFFRAIDNKTNGHLGAKQSHCAVIKMARKTGIKKLMIIEDDIKFLKPLGRLTAPEKWDILYLGGEVIKLKGHNVENKEWRRCSNFNAHAYIINMENTVMLDKILKCLAKKILYDFHLYKKIQGKFFSFMHLPMLLIQENGYSDCEKKYVDYTLMSQSADGFKKPEYVVNKDGNYVLKLDKLKDYPAVSIVTPTFKRRNMFAIAIKNFYEFNYPREKLQWVIVDDSPEGEDVEDLLPKDDTRIKYIRIKEWIPTMGMKRNTCIKHADNEIIIHMDDDDYYPPESIYSRVALLQKYASSGIQLVGCSEIGVYDIVKGTSNMSGDGTFSIAEGTMAYFKTFWEAKNYNDEAKSAEYIDFIGERFHQIMDMPYAFVMIAFKHGGNTVASEVGQGVLNKNTGETHDFLEQMDEETQFFVKQLRDYVLKKKKLVAPDFNKL